MYSMMVLLATLNTMFIPTTMAFVVVTKKIPCLISTPTTQLYGITRPDAAEAIQAAMMASQMFGKTSPEARVAWDIVEEMDAACNTPAYAGSNFEEECQWMDRNNRIGLAQACEQYEQQREELTHRIEQESAQQEHLQRGQEERQWFTRELRAIPLLHNAPNRSNPSPRTEIHQAVREARDVTNRLGLNAAESRIAWETVEEISSADISPAIGKRLDEECLVNDAMEACLALEELNRVLNLGRTRSDMGLNA